MRSNKTMKYFTVALPLKKYEELKSLALKESRPLAQMARVIIEKELRKSERGKS